MWQGLASFSAYESNLATIKVSTELTSFVGSVREESTQAHSNWQHSVLYGGGLISSAPTEPIENEKTLAK